MFLFKKTLINPRTDTYNEKFELSLNDIIIVILGFFLGYNNNFIISYVSSSFLVFYNMLNHKKLENGDFVTLESKLFINFYVLGIISNNISFISILGGTLTGIFINLGFSYNLQLKIIDYMDLVKLTMFNFLKTNMWYVFEKINYFISKNDKKNLVSIDINLENDD